MNEFLKDIEELKNLVFHAKSFLQTMDVVKDHFAKNDGWPSHVAPISKWGDNLKNSVKKCEQIFAGDEK